MRQDCSFAKTEESRPALLLVLGAAVATNHLGQFAFATGLHEALGGRGSARIVGVSSSGGY